MKLIAIILLLLLSNGCFRSHHDRVRHLRGKDDFEVVPTDPIDGDDDPGDGGDDNGDQAPVPEPASLLLLGAGLGATALARRAKKKT